MDDHKVDQMASVRGHKLTDSSTYFDWRRFFDPTAKILDIWGVFTGETPILPEPTEEDCLVYQDGRRNNNPQVDQQRTQFKLEFAYKRWEANRAKVKLARLLVQASTSDIVYREIEDTLLQSPRDAVAKLKSQYGISNDRAQTQLMNEVTQLKIWRCENATDYITRHKALRNDLVRAGYTKTDTQFVTDMIMGLGRDYAEFRRRWEWDTDRTPNDPPNVEFFCTRLRAEEAQVAADKKNKSKKPDDKKSDDKKTDKKERRCSYPDCPNPKGHNEEDCWTKYPEKKPKGLKQETNNTTPKEGGRRIAALSLTHPENFSQALLAASSKHSGDYDADPPTHWAPQLINKLPCYDVPNMSDLSKMLTDKLHKLRCAVENGDNPELAFTVQLLQRMPICGKTLRLIEKVYLKTDSSPPHIELTNMSKDYNPTWGQASFVIDRHGATMTAKDPLLKIAAHIADTLNPSKQQDEPSTPTHQPHTNNTEHDADDSIWGNATFVTDRHAPI
ncbi:hypothetical protein PG985_006034 [Apiospora marii]|uniref:uncharacterized protein n=1 Tax=Apiospora marii TaxID=335849 RepID=UPI0031308EAE